MQRIIKILLILAWLPMKAQDTIVLENYSVLSINADTADLIDVYTKTTIKLNSNGDTLTIVYYSPLSIKLFGVNLYEFNIADTISIEGYYICYDTYKISNYSFFKANTLYYDLYAFDNMCTIRGYKNKDICKIIKKLKKDHLLNDFLIIENKIFKVTKLTGAKRNRNH